MNKLIAVTIGDIEGIGIDLLLKEFNKNKIKNFVLFTNIQIFKKNIKFVKNKINIININSIKKYDKKMLNIFTYETKNKHTNTIDSLNFAYNLTKKNLFIGILTLPLNKLKINKFVSQDFIDQTTFFSKKEKIKNNNMIFYYNNKFFIPLTIHIELKNVYKYFKNKNSIVKKIQNLQHSLENDFKINKPKIIFAGINPHAGENGLISNDENNYLRPILKILKSKEIDCSGPVSGDGIINKNNLKYFDAFVFAYHDQALIPFKIISNFNGINFTSNLKIIRVSPSHGTAESLKNSQEVSSKGIIKCFELIKKIYKNRN